MCLTEQDGFRSLNTPGEALKQRIRIQFVDQYGVEEAGVDGGGLFKDFVENLIKEVLADFFEEVLLPFFPGSFLRQRKLEDLGIN